MASEAPPKLSVISLFTEDLEASKAFYIDKLGATICFEDEESCSVRFSNVLFNLLVAHAADDLVKPSQVAAPGSGKRFQLTTWVDDLDAEMDKLRKKGVEFTNGPETKPWGMRVVNFEDPAGHSWEVAQKV